MGERPLFGPPQLVDTIDCWKCGAKMNGVTGVGPNRNERPGPGTIALCAHCGAVGVIGEGLRNHKPTDEEAWTIALNPHLTYAFFAMWLRREGYPPPPS